AGCVFQAVDQPVAKFRVYQQQKSTSAGEETYRLVHDTYAEMLVAEPERASEAFLAELADARIGWLWQASSAESDSGNTLRGLSLWLKTFRLDPRVVFRKRFWRTLAEPAIHFVRSR